MGPGLEQGGRAGGLDLFKGGEGAIFSSFNKLVELI